MILTICQWLAQRLPFFTIAKDGLAYLTRYYFFLKDRLYANVFLHHFHRSDMDMGQGGYGLLHCHPWPGLSFILHGGYIEERLQKDGSIIKRTVKPFTFNFIGKNTFHRVDLLDEKVGAWSIFLTGSRKNNTWYFYDRVSHQRIEWNKVAGAIE